MCPRRPAVKRGRATHAIVAHGWRWHGFGRMTPRSMALSVRTRLVRSLILHWGLLRRAMTLGVRVLVEDGAGRILLVRHTYVPGWHFPGGAVDPGECAEAAAIRELREETGVALSTRPKLVGIYRNIAGTGRDHVVLFRTAVAQVGALPAPNSEIAEVGWFARSELPPETTRATLARLAELFRPRAAVVGNLVSGATPPAPAPTSRDEVLRGGREKRGRRRASRPQRPPAPARPTSGCPTARAESR